MSYYNNLNSRQQTNSKQINFERNHLETSCVYQQLFDEVFFQPM